MTVERHAGRTRIVCDCGASQARSFARDEFATMLLEAKAEGFAIEKVAGEWVHSCAGCAARPALRGRLL